MTKEKKRGTSGNAVAFISRGKALKKLQVSLDDFRRLCILKGIYPRDPRKKLEGSDKTYYLRKDIDFLAHERLIGTIRNQQSHRKKVVKARAKRRIDILKQLSLTAPRARLDHLVVERYPNFEDAVRELDDPLCIIALFANLPAERRVGISPRRIANCQRLLREFCQYVAHTRALKRTFVSVKGYYFQARVCNINVTWITPHRFTQVMPSDVDFSVMLNFLELYECILTFVNFRLYTGKNLVYPPKLDVKADANALSLGSLLVETSTDANTVGEDVSQKITQLSADALREAEKVALGAVDEDEDDEEDEEEEDVDSESDDADDDSEKASAAEGGEGVGNSDEDKTAGNVEQGAINSAEVLNESDKNKDSYREEEVVDDDRTRGVFHGKSIVLGREVPFVELEFTLKAAGAMKITREDNLTEGPDRLEGYTHWIIDRPAIAGDRNMSIEYVQPQYVFDSVNSSLLLPTTLYGVGAHLPPHLSPFVTEEDDGGYRPWYQEVLERIKDGDASVVKEAAAVVYADGVGKTKFIDGSKGKKGKDQGKKNKKTEKGENEDRSGADSDAVEEADPVQDVVMGDDTASAEAPSDADPVGDGDGNGDDVNEVVDDENESEEEGEDNEAEVVSEDEKEGMPEEKDSEGEEERLQTEEQQAEEKESKEMAALMLSRRKMKRYRKVKGAENRKDAIKQRLNDKRKKLEEQRGPASDGKRKKRKKVAF